MAPWQEEILVPGRPSTLKLSEYLESGPHVPSGPPPGLDLPLTLLERRSGPQIPQVREPTKRMKRMAFTSFLRTPNGAEETCLKLDSAMLDSSYVAELVAAVLPDLPSLACDPQGIQVLSKLLSVSSRESLCKLARRLQGSILKLTKDREETNTKCRDCSHSVLWSDINSHFMQLSSFKAPSRCLRAWDIGKTNHAGQAWLLVHAAGAALRSLRAPGIDPRGTERREL